MSYAVCGTSLDFRFWVLLFPPNILKPELLKPSTNLVWFNFLLKSGYKCLKPSQRRRYQCLFPSLWSLRAPHVTHQSEIRDVLFFLWLGGRQKCGLEWKLEREEFLRWGSLRGHSHSAFTPGTSFKQTSPHSMISRKAADGTRNASKPRCSIR